MKFGIGRGYLLQLSATSVQLSLSAMHTALFDIHQKLKGKTMKAKNSEVTRSINGVVFSTEAGKAAVDHKKHTEAAGKSLEKFNDAAIAMHKAGEKVGHRRTCKNAQAFFDALVAGGLKGNSAANCLTTFRDVVKTGIAAEGFNKSRNDANANANAEGKSKAGVKVTPADDGKQADAALRALWNCNMAMFLLDTIESAYQDGKGSDPTLAGALKWVMDSRGIPFNKDGKATTKPKAKAKAE